jgi:tetratricopeptide (TPR) repeat protein
VLRKLWIWWKKDFEPVYKLLVASGIIVTFLGVVIGYFKDTPLQENRSDSGTAALSESGSFDTDSQGFLETELGFFSENSEENAERLRLAIHEFNRGNSLAASENFAKVSESEVTSIMRAARAEFGLGEVAETELDWSSAEEHFSRAASLSRDFHAMFKAREFSWRVGKYDQALFYGAEMISLAVSAMDQRLLAIANHSHAITLESVGDFTKAEELFRESLKSARETHETDPKELIKRLTNLANLLRSTERLDEAESLSREALALAISAYGVNHNFVATVQNSLGNILFDRASFNEAEFFFRAALESGRKTLEPKHPDVAIRLNNLARLLRATSRGEEAIPLYREAIEILRGAIGPVHQDIGIALNNLASLMQSIGRPEEATPLYIESIEMLRASLGDDHPNVQRVARNTLSHLRTHAPDHPERAELEAVFGVPD